MYRLLGLISRDSREKRDDIPQKLLQKGGAEAPPSLR
jgi:hypothetical protein